MKKIKIGIIGCGAVAYRWYLKGLAGKNKNYQLIAVCDIDLERARKAAVDFGVPHYTNKLEEMMEFEIDLAVILTRHQDHPEHITFFLKQGVHVYSEKPFAPNNKVGADLVTLAKKKKLVFGSAPQVMFSSRNQTVKKHIENGLIGKLAFARVSSSNLGPAGRKDTDYDPQWFYAEGGSLSSLGIYGLSALIWILGMPIKISSMQGIAMPNRVVAHGPFKGKKFQVTAPDSVVALFDFGSNIFAMFDGSYVVTTPSPYEMEFHGTKGSLLVNGFGGPESIIFNSLNNEKTLVGPDDNCHKIWNLSMAVEDTARAIIEKRKPLASAEFALNVIKIIDAMEISTAQRVHVTV
jgi:predicted dehydrogenase